MKKEKEDKIIYSDFNKFVPREAKIYLFTRYSHAKYVQHFESVARNKFEGSSSVAR